MILIDVIDSGQGLIAWLHDGRNQFVPCVFEPTFFVYGQTALMRTLKTVLEREGATVGWQKVKTLWGMRWMLGVTCKPHERDRLARLAERKSDFECELFNTTIGVEELFMFANKVFPLAHVEVVYDEIGRILSLSTTEKPTDDYELPPLKTATLTLEDGEVIFDTERMDLAAFRLALEREDPDIILADDADLRFLLAKGITLSRIGADIVRGKGGSYFSYGKVLHRDPSVHLRGRLHLRSHGTIYGGWSLLYAWEVARICCLTVQNANGHAVGSCMSNAQRAEAFKRGYAIAKTWSCVERWRSGTELFAADRGPMLIEAVTGTHVDVYEIDFTSLYPSLIVKHNISTETLFCPCCPDHLAPDTSINTCTRGEGIMPAILDPIIKRRAQYKARGGDSREGALKSLLVTCFGYLGFRKSAFARIEAHQAILAYARETLREAMEVCEEHGFSVLQGYTDCLWVRKEGAGKQDVDALREAIGQQAGVPIKVDAHYRQITFLPSTRDPLTPAPVRYVGIMTSGEVKTRGIALRRHDTPSLISRLQADIIDDIAQGRSPQGRLAEALKRLREGQVLPEQLMVSRTISKPNYVGKSPGAVMVAQLRAQGLDPQPGQRMRYLIKQQDAALAQNRYGTEGGYDHRTYAKLIRKAAKDIGVEEERQMTLIEVMREEVLTHRARCVPSEAL